MFLASSSPKKGANSYKVSSHFIEVISSTIAVSICKERVQENHGITCGMCVQLQMDCVTQLYNYVSGSTQNPPPKPGKLGFDAVDSGSELTQVYTDMVACHVSNLGPSQHHNVSSLYDIILYLAARLCNIPEYMLQLITSLRYCNHSI